jgi:hypothetical protein
VSETGADHPVGPGATGGLPAERSLWRWQLKGREVPNARPLPDWVRRLAWVLDDAFAIPGMRGRRAGVDGLIAFIPVVGDAAGIIVSMVIVLAGVGAGVSVPTVVRMALNVGVEALIGLVPVIGGLFDLVFKANNRNVALIEADLADRSATRRSSLRVLVVGAVVVVGTVLFLVAIVVAAIAVLIWMLARLV